MQAARYVPDLLLDGGTRPAPTVERMGLIDAPKVDRTAANSGFHWKPILILIGTIAILMLGVAVL
jgi:hypothetical protein